MRNIPHSNMRMSSKCDALQKKKPLQNQQAKTYTLRARYWLTSLEFRIENLTVYLNVAADKETEA